MTKISTVPLLTRRSIIPTVAKRAGTTREVSTNVLNALIETLAEQLAAGGNATLIGLGTFAVSQSKRTQRYSMAEQKIVPAEPHLRLTFRPAAQIKTRLRATKVPAAAA